MKAALQTWLITLPLLLTCSLKITAAPLAFGKSNEYVNHPKTTGHIAAAADTAVLTYRYDNLRTGATTHETTLTPGNVNVHQFGRRVTYPVDGQVYAQPLYMPNLTINGQQHNVVFVATEHDSVYAFDADSSNPTDGQLWRTSFLVNGATTPTPGDVSCTDTTPEMGITGTPVIDPETDTLYVVAFTNENGQLVYRLHALDITTGRDKASLIIQASVAGYGQGSVDGRVSFDARHERQRTALLLSRGNVYIAWGSFCDDNPYHGWIMSYTFDGSALHQTHVYNDTPDASEGGIWSPGAISADASGNIYYVSGNGSFNLSTGGQSAGDSVVKLSPDLRLLDYFTPFNQACLASIDADLGSSGPLVEPSHNMIVVAGKEGRVYVINLLHMGHYHTIVGACHHQNLRDVDKIVQESPPRAIGGLFNTPGYWNGYLYLASVNRPTGAYKLTGSGTFRSFTPDSSTPEIFGFTGGNLVISSNGPDDGILWTIDRGEANGPALRAYDATNLSHELYNSNQYADRDALDGFVKFTCPIVANGEVFVPTSNSLEIYGQVNGNAPPPPASYNNAGISDDSFSGHSLANYDGHGYSYSLGALQNAGITPGASIISHDVTFIWPNLPAGALDNYSARGQTILIAPINSATILAFLGSSTGGNADGTATLNYSDGSTQNFMLGLTDWTSATPAFGNKLIAAMTYRNGPARKQFTRVYLFSAQVALQAGKTLKSVTLPTIADKTKQLHIFTITTNGPLGNYNNIGTSDDDNTGEANLDGHGDSYSAQALQAQGCNPGDNAFFGGTNGTVFQWPAGTSGEPNNYIAIGQRLPVEPLNNAGTLAFAGASVNGSSSGVATINYSDGSHQTFLLGFSDWTLDKGRSRPAFGNQVMYTMPYHNTPNGRTQVKTYVFFASIALQQGKTVQSVTLPAPSGKGQMHIFAVATRPAASDTKSA
ncbi:MAG TPA: hypothetical protein VKV19_08740 [Ktedonobacteraceae bacterium]|nr:hypothetical protein [Ktedonobacteraceae bacterium]